MVSVSYISHISSNLIGRKLANAILILVSIASQLYQFLKKRWQVGHNRPVKYTSQMVSGTGETLPVKSKHEEGDVRLYCNAANQGERM